MDAGYGYYRLTMVAWLLPAVGPAVAVVLLMFTVTRAVCGGTTSGCLPGLELILAAPLLLWGLLVSGPSAVRRKLRRARDPHADATARWATILALPGVALGVVTLGLGLLALPLAARWMATRPPPAPGGRA